MLSLDSENRFSYNYAGFMLIQKYTPTTTLDLDLIIKFIGKLSQNIPLPNK